MRFYDIDCRAMTDREVAHAYLRETLDLPGWYGGNLDALYDCLTDMGERTVLSITAPDALEDAMGPYGQAMLNAFRDAAADNPRLRLVFWD